ncbi:alpha/beta hydrolase [Actinomadura viridis]|uniref:Pimeloyl-ACP methyl ester carboxylesterase n=1 Tax=Actinomadura viridis TaxID=58110 RepID=A0A931DF93_9ACTN|nr:alpha/beta hydrolase [Actinomadura viridis]MBG6086476.1 pimeloyl-ACP methyl ester carboxylesterase [Actinomadura viridis]
MASGRRRRMGVAGAVAGVGAAGVGAAVGLRRLAVGRVRLRPDPDADEPFGELRGRPLTVQADDGVPLYVEVDGPDDAPLTIVFSHGYTLNQDSWHFQRRDLAAGLDRAAGRDHGKDHAKDHGKDHAKYAKHAKRPGAKQPGGRRLRLVFWDQRSHGRSGRSKPTHATVDQTGEDLYTVLRATVEPDAPVVLVGHSMGGMSVMALAHRHPELFEGGKGEPRVVGVALVNTSCGDLAEMTLGLPLVLAKVLRPLAPGTLRGLGRQADLVDRARALGADFAFIVTRRMAFADRYVSPTVVAFLEQMIRATPIDVIAEFYPELLAHDKTAALETIGRVPVLVMSGGEDRLTPPQHGRSIAEALPDAEYVEVGDAGHVLPLEYPGVVTGGLRRLVGRIGSAREERTA